MSRSGDGKHEFFKDTLKACMHSYLVVLDIALIYFLTVILHTQVVKALVRLHRLEFVYLFDLNLYILFNNFSVILGLIFLG